VVVWLAFGVRAYSQGVHLTVVNVGTNTFHGDFTHNAGCGSENFSIGPGASHLLEDFGESGTYNLYCAVDCSLLWTHVVTGGGFPVFTDSLNVSGCVIQTNCFDTVSVNNPATFYELYYLYVDGNPTYQVITVAPGATKQLQFPNPGCVSHVYAVVPVGIAPSQPISAVTQQDNNGWLADTVPLTTGKTPSQVLNVTTRDVPTPPTPTTVGAPPPVPYTNSLTATNEPIVYTNFTGQATNAANNGSVQQGFNAVYTGIVQGDQGIIDQLRQNQLTDASGFHGVSNELHELNGKSDSGLGSESSGSGLTNLTLSGATNAGGTAMSSVVGDVDAMAADVPSISDPGTGTAPSIDIVAGTAGTFHIAPAEMAWFTQLAGTALAIWTLILWLGYALKCVKDVFEMADKLTLSRGTNIQPMEVEVVGTGGNAIGVAMASLFSLLVMAVYAAFLALTFTSLSGSVLGWSHMHSAVTSDPLAGMGSGALWLLQQFFPWPLATGLAFAYLTWWLSCVKILVLTRASVKIIFGA